MKGLFITFEGVEGCGKSTQVERQRARLESLGHTVMATREPGGTPIAEAIRRILLDPANEAMSATTELLLYEAARAQHVDEKIKPALSADHIVLCDRFMDSTTAYQVAGRGLERQAVELLHAIATSGLKPDLTIVVDVPAEVGLERVAQTKKHDRIELESIEFHARVRDAFLKIARIDSKRVHVVDGTQPIDRVTQDINGLIDAIVGAK